MDVLDQLGESARTGANGVFVAAGVQEALIEEAEARLEIVFGEQYRRFLLMYGFALVGGDRIFGLDDRVKQIDQQMVVRETLWLAEKTGVHAVCVSHDGVECYYALDVTQGIGTDRLCVIEAHSGEQQKFWPHGSSFFDYLQARLGG
jgi:hypothetical protein